ncbi:zinc ribbon domain-containing protein [Saccharopolyspora sp. NPDC002376]
MKVTRIAYSKNLNAGKYAALEEQARRLGRVRAMVWARYGSPLRDGVKDRKIRDAWMADGTADSFGVLANAWKETVRDAVADIAAYREAGKVKVRKAVHRRYREESQRKKAYMALKRGRWQDDSFLARQMRQHVKHGVSCTANQIVVRSDQYNTWTMSGGDVWIDIPGLERRQKIAIPLNTPFAPSGTLRLILRAGYVEVHYAIDAPDLLETRPCGAGKLGVDKGYTEVLTDSDGVHHGQELGALLRAESDFIKVKNARRAKIRSVAEKARKSGNLAKADRIVRNNLGHAKRNRRRSRFKSCVRSVTFTAVHAVVDKASHVVTEDLTRSFVSRRKLGKNTNRRLAAWTKGVTAEALSSVAERRGSALTLVNAAYSSQVVPCCQIIGRRCGDRLHCTRCGELWQADHAAAINILERDGDPAITIWTPFDRVKELIQERDRLRTRLPVQDSSAPARRANYPIPAAMLKE